MSESYCLESVCPYLNRVFPKLKEALLRILTEPLSKVSIREMSLYQK